MTHIGMRVYWTAIGMFFSSLLASASRDKAQPPFRGQGCSK